MSRQELADLVNEELALRCACRVMLDAHYIGKLERGVTRWPQAAYRAAFRTVLGASSDAELGFFIVRRQPETRSIRCLSAPSQLVEPVGGRAPNQ
jgi:hypothetical protein